MMMIMETERSSAEERAARRGGRQDRPPLPALPPPSKREHIDKVAKFVAEAEDLQVEQILLKLLRLTRNRDRWGFLAAGDPYHAYYGRRVAERRRVIASGSK